MPPLLALPENIISQKKVQLVPIGRSDKELSKGFDFLGYRVVPGRRLRSSAESKRRFAEKFRRLYEQGADSMRLWRYAERWCRWQRAGLDGLVSLKEGLRKVVIRQLRTLGIVALSRDAMPRPAPGRRRRHQPRAELLRLPGGDPLTVAHCYLARFISST